MADSVKKFRVREYEKKMIEVSAELEAESYRPGDMVEGVLRIKSADGSQI